MTIGYLTMQDYPAYTVFNSYDAEALLNHQQISTAAVSPWSAQQPIGELAVSEADASDAYDDLPASVMERLVTLGLIMVFLLSSSVLLGSTTDRLTQTAHA